MLLAVLTSACHLLRHDDPAPPGQVIPGDGVSPDTASPNAILLDSSNPFFRDFGENGRVCGSCHHEDQGWTITPGFAASLKDGDALFVFDGSDCLPPGAANPAAAQNSTELRSFGNIRVELPVPKFADYVLSLATDPLDCPDPLDAANLRMYRRPLPIANSAFLAAVMWDGRESIELTVAEDLRRQADDATRIHAQADAPLAADDRATIVTFETGIFHGRRTAGALDLATAGGRGGPAFLFESALADFHLGQNRPFLPGFSNVVFDLYEEWEPAGGQAPTALAASIGRGEELFNSKPITVDAVPGLNGPNDPSSSPIQGTCSSCHSTPNVGNVSVPLFLDIGVTSERPLGRLDVSRLPSYRFTEIGTGREVTLSDPGRGLVTGKFADLGKTKVPHLRGLTRRAPYFHNGRAALLSDVVDFYEQRFRIGLTAQERADLLAFLGAL